MEFKNGCTQAPGCPGNPTHVYRPSGGRPVAYCASCAPGFLTKNFASLPKTSEYANLTQKVLTDMSPEPAAEEPTPEPTPEPEPVEQEAEPQEEKEAPKPRRTRRKKTAPTPADEPAADSDE